MTCRDIIRSLIIAAPVSLRLLQTQAPAQSPSSSGEPTTIIPSSVCGTGATYDQLTDRWRHAPSQQKINLGTAPIELTIQSSEFDERPATAKAASGPDFCFWHELSVGVNISTAGEGYAFANGEGSFRGGGGGKLAPEVFARLELLMKKLPDDHHSVPPATRRIVVAVERDGTANVRLYDSAELPDEIIEMIRLSGARIKVVTPLFKAKRMVPVEEAGPLNLSMPRVAAERALSPDGSISVDHNFTTNLLTVAEARAGPNPPKVICTIPEFWQPERGGYVVNSEFSPDSRFLLVTWGLRVGALLFDTTTWQPITDPKLFPQHLKEYLHSPDWHWGIAVTEAGETLVWDQQAHRIVSKLPGLGDFEQVIHETDAQGHEISHEPSAEIRGAAFSPDGTRVALYHGPDNVFKLRLSIFDVRKGTKERDLWPVEWMSYASGQPVWWNDGRWVVAPWAGRFSGGGMGVWDVQTGRFVGALDTSGCDASFGPVSEGARLSLGCFNGDEQLDKVLEWDVESVRKQVLQSVKTGEDIPSPKLEP